MVDDAPLPNRPRGIRRLIVIHWPTVAAYFTTFVVSIAGPIWVHRLRPSDLSYPWRVKDSDLSSVYSLAQALGQSWTGLVHHSLGAPFNANLALAFIPDDLHIEVLRILVHVTQNPFTAVNSFYLLTYGLCGMTFLFLCEQQKLNRLVSIAMSVAYAWLPYHFTRMNDGHVFLAAYYMIPIGFVVLLNLIEWLTGCSRFFLPKTTKIRFLFVFAILGVGASGAYYGLFFSLLTLSTVILVPQKHIRSAEALKRVVSVTCVAVAFVLAPVLRNVWAKTHGLHSQLSRSPLESIQFGGSISRLFVPWGVWIPNNLRPVVERQEFEWLAVPLLAVLGIWLLTLGLVRRLTHVYQSKNSQLVDSLQFLFFWSLLFFSAGGLSLLFAYGIDSSFRTWNRFAILIMTAALLAISAVLTRFVKTRLMAMTTALLLLALAFSTQLIPVKSAGIGAEPDRAASNDFRIVKHAAEIINRTIPKGCQILQLPVMSFPEGGLVDGVGNGEHLWLPLLSNGYRWSYGSPKGSDEGDYWIGEANPIATAIREGFCAVVYIHANDHSPSPSEQGDRKLVPFLGGQILEIFRLPKHPQEQAT